MSPSLSTNSSLPPALSSLPFADVLQADHATLEVASWDFGHIVREYPLAVLRPTSIQDIVILVKFIHDNDDPVLASLTVAVRGNGHSVRGQAMARDGIVVDMSSLRISKNNQGGGWATIIPQQGTLRCYADVGGEQLWIDVLKETLKHGLAPVSWTDYLYLTVGGTISNGGISGTAFRFGPQISNVHEMDVITGTGELLTCSRHENSDLFDAVLGGRGQFGIITRARIVLDQAPKRVKWVRLLYDDFSAFTRDQEHLISINGRFDERALEHLEGFIFMHHGSPDEWRSSYFPSTENARIATLITINGMVYCLEVAKFYDDDTELSVGKVMENLLQGLSYLPGFRYEKDVSYVDFLNRVRDGEMKLRSQGLWDVPHPWLNLFVPRSRIADLKTHVLDNIIMKNKITTGTVLCYPMNKIKWDAKTSAVVPDEDVFYTVEFLQSSGFDDWQKFDAQYEEILRWCKEAKLGVKQHLHRCNTVDEWKDHFGSKWSNFERVKAKFDPRMILSPGQRIFNNN
ncbi:hypothetical protein MLD38_000195 [Melastoma candidum]|uniref:Uncharacterized protein n=1 Tax=Melastoma candidum TaxID=119954 RepID=A0ACB9S990_9MYRT|nr:hypothetical protein MLD38_000195 [Melastoma candidum]